MATASIAKKRRTASKDTAQAAEYEKLFRKMKQAKTPVLTEELAKDIERIASDPMEHVWRRMALAFLMKPFREIVKMTETDRDAAVHLACAEICIREYVKKQRELLDWIDGVALRLMMAECVRDDMAEITAEAKKMVNSEAAADAQVSA